MTLITFTLEAIRDDLVHRESDESIRRSRGSAVLSVDPAFTNKMKLAFRTDLIFSMTVPSAALTINAKMARTHWKWTSPTAVQFRLAESFPDGHANLKVGATR